MKNCNTKVVCLLLTFTLPVVSANAAIKQVQTIDQLKQNALEGVTLLSNEQLQVRIQSNPKLVLLDVRTQREFQAGHMRGAAWVERGIAEFVLVGTLPDHKAEIIIYCKKGFRSALVLKKLRDIGYSNVKVHAGFDSWTAAGNSYVNYLGESRLLKPAVKTSADFGPDYYQAKS